jgi:hypothetical protein
MTKGPLDEWYIVGISVLGTASGWIAYFTKVCG